MKLVIREPVKRGHPFGFLTHKKRANKTQIKEHIAEPYYFFWTCWLGSKDVELKMRNHHVC